MPVLRIRFRPRPRVSGELLADTVAVLCGALRSNGQIHGEEIVVAGRAWRDIVVRAPYVDALEARHASAAGRAALARLASLSLRPPSVRRLDARRAPRSSLPLRRAGVLVLSTDMFDRESAVRTGRGDRVPAYLLGVDDRVRERLHAWTTDLRTLDRVWIGSGPLAIAAYRQLADPRSALAREGRGLCRELERATGIPTYYDLYRYHGRRRGEERRPCPLCGRPWRSRPRLPWLRFFDFRCTACRLLSNVAYSRGDAEDERYARIGEPRSR